MKFILYISVLIFSSYSFAEFRFNQECVQNELVSSFQKLIKNEEAKKYLKIEIEPMGGNESLIERGIKFLITSYKSPEIRSGYLNLSSQILDKKILAPNCEFKIVGSSSEKFIMIIKGCSDKDENLNLLDNYGNLKWQSSWYHDGLDITKCRELNKDENNGIRKIEIEKNRNDQNSRYYQNVKRK